jgi:hypothetical protein
MVVFKCLLYLRGAGRPALTAVMDETKKKKKVNCEQEMGED